MSGKVFNMTGGSGRGIKLVSIDIAKGPTKTIYRPGQIFDPAGMEVVATYTNGATLLATGWTYYPSGAIQAGTNNIEIVYTESGVTASAMQPITVRTEVFQVPTYTGSFIYNGTQQSPSWNGYESSEMTIGGTTSAIHAGSYQTIFSLKDKIGTQWDDGTVEDKSVDWTIERASIDVPTQSGSLIYDGDIKSPTWAGYDNIKMTIGGTTSGTNAGSYDASFTPKTDYRWSDGTTTAKTVSWSIGKATGTLTVSKSSITLNKTTPSTTFTIGGNHDGTLSIRVTSGTNVASVSVSGSTVTVKNVNQTTGSAVITVSCTAGTNYTAPSNKTVNVTAKFVTIYGVYWDGTSTTAWSRTDASAGFTDPSPAVSNGSGSSPFDSLLPWSGMEKVTDSAAGVLVKIPKFWYKWTKSGNTLKLQIADGETDGFRVSPAHADRGDGSGERDVVYVGRYHCASGYKSTTGVAQQVSITRSTARTNIHNLGATIWQFDYAMRVTIQMLYLVEFANWNSQAKIGYGCSARNSKANNGQTDAMKYHTGTTAANRTTYGYTQYRYIEGLWDNVYDWMDGCYYNGNGMYVIKTPSAFSDSSGGSLIGKPSIGYPSAIAVSTVSGLEWAIYPTAASGSDSTYVADYWYYNGSYPCLFCGGDYSKLQSLGLFYVSCNSVSYTYTNIGCRLQKLP